MRKPAPADHPVLDLIRDRWSPRAFSDREVGPEVLRSLFEAARWAPSSNNEQPWAFLVATRNEKAGFARALEPLFPGNAAWARRAFVLGYAVAKLAFAKNNAPNRNSHYDTGAAMAMLTLEATARGLGVHQMAGFDAQAARAVYAIPAGWEAIAAFAAGYPGDPASLPEGYRDREAAPRVRKPMREFVMSEKWGHTAPFVGEQV